MIPEDQKLNPSEIENTRKSVKGLCGLARKLGYIDTNFQLQNSDGSYIGDLLEFLEDNEGACGALIEWASEHYGKDEEETEDLTECPDCGNVGCCDNCEPSK